MEQLHKLEALGIAMLDVIRDERYEREFRTELRHAYDTVELAICRLQAEILPPASDGNPTTRPN